MSEYQFKKNGELNPKIKALFQARSFGKATKIIADMRAQILDDFCIAYLADKYVPLDKLELVETHEGNKYTWSFRIKRGRPKKEKNG